MLTCYYATMQILPALDILGDDAVRLAQGDYDRVIFRRPLDDFLTRILATKPDLVHVVDLQAARDGNLRLDKVIQCATLCAGTPLQFSGGIRSIEAATAVLAAGASRVIVGTAAWSTPEALPHFVEALGERLVVALDVRDQRLAVKGWLTGAGWGVEEALEHCVQSGVTRLHVTAIARDGTMRGPDLDLYRQACASGLRVVAAGGVRDDNDIAALAALGCEGAVMGLGYLARLGLTVEGDE